jgi:hypothetical protein
MGSPCRISELLLGDNLAFVLFGRARSVGAVFLTHNIRVLDCEFDNDVSCGYLSVVSCDLCSVSSHLNVAVARLVLCRDPAPVDRESDAVDEAGVVTGEEDDRRGKFLGLSHAACRR